MGIVTATDPIEAVREQMHALRGRLFQTIEAVGLPDVQTKAIKSLIRSTTYDAQATIEAAIRRERT